MRLPLLPPSELTPEQKVLFEDMKKLISSRLNVFKTESDDGALMGPWNPWLHEPRIGGAIWQLAKAITVESKLPEEVRQIAILVVGGRFGAAYELYAHVAVARESGMSPAKISAVASCSRPADLTEIEAVAYDVAHALVRGGVLPQVCYSEALKLFGQAGVNELIYLVGTYCLVSVTLNGFNVPAPEHE